MAQTIVGMELADLQKALAESSKDGSRIPIPPFRARQLYDAVYHQRIQDPSAISNLPKPLRARLAEEFSLGWPSVEQKFSSQDGTIRYLLKLGDGKTVETVWMPSFSSSSSSSGPGEEEAGRATICISSQVGCPVDCKFCLTALMGLERSLTAGEIIGQVLVAAGTQDVHPSKTNRLNIVMMGQGEPLLNLQNVLKATRILIDPAGMAISPRRITVSTSGIIPKITELGQAPERPKLAISLNASTEEQRQALMPITRKYHLKDLIDACRAYPLRPWEKLTFEYVLLKGVNDTDADARRVVRLLDRLDAKVNLIALNPGPGIAFETPTPERVQSFQGIVRRSLPCFVRKPRGLDVYAACGQLKRMELVGIGPGSIS
jgi:23S rRNA (adenine2503-C2)-methyltransferase